ncbi:lasso peptide biosynthesis B2 protein [Pantoea dispersa]|uniref:lasso peptide biosynthesis B2 protein n=1 Tax=Pantoea dispersa TaxID=59814 RepID=UPI001BA87A9A|nr:lasso peptide biosynthesis B2 protein [Pantoea dispersa]MBS0907773.1 lasso peptide biosynthesis B2 protein [Pantoea dispersa]
MVKNEPNHLKAYSNGKIIFLNLEKNIYLISKNDTENLTAKKNQEEYVAKLRDNLRWPENLKPSIKIIYHYIYSFLLSRRHRCDTIKEQLCILTLHSNTNKKESSNKEIEEYSTLYQYLRNILPKRPLCLEDSVCCFLFLSRYINGLEFVIGVKFPPFAAHAWVESHNIILNDTKLAVEDYSVILRYKNEGNL